MEVAIAPELFARIWDRRIKTICTEETTGGEGVDVK